MNNDTLAIPASTPEDLLGRFLALRRERKLRHRDAAQALGVSECEAIAAAVGGAGTLSAVRLKGPWPELFEQLPALGKVLALTRNESAVHEKTGPFENMSHEGLVGLALGADIDLRIFYLRWAHAYAVTEATATGTQRSLQIFDAHGVAIHKVFLRDDSNLGAWPRFVERNAHASQQAGQTVAPAPDRNAPLADRDVDVDAFRQAWAKLADTHEFFPLLRRFKVARTQALRLAPDGYAYRVQADAARVLLETTASRAVPIMCFVGNAGMIQIHTGPVRRFEVIGSWLNVLDPGFSLHLRGDRIASAWVVRKPTRDGDVTSLELFDADGETLAMFFGERKPGRAELESWRALVDALPRMVS